MQYNAIIKDYNSNFRQIVVSNHTIYDSSRVYNSKKNKRSNIDNCKTKYSNNINRSKHKVYDIIMLNNFDLWCTLTFNPKLVDSFNKELVKKKTLTWLSNLVKRKNLKYIAVPEFHDSGRIHIHLLCNDIFGFASQNTSAAVSPKRSSRENAAAVGSNKMNHGGCVPYEEFSTKNSITCGKQSARCFNIDKWNYGFSLAILLDKNQGYNRLANYISKYITKDSDYIFGRHYVASKNLIRTPDKHYAHIDYASFNADYTISHGDYFYKLKNKQTTLFVRSEQGE